MDNPRRRNLFRVSKFQAPVLNLIVGLSVVILILMTTNITFLSYDISNVIYHPEKTTAALKTTIILSLIILPLILFLGIIWAFNISNHIVGPFERIIHELDDVIDKGNKRHLTARKGDDLAHEVLKRVNILIDRMS